MIPFLERLGLDEPEPLSLDSEYPPSDDLQSLVRRELEACAAIADAHAQECLLAGESREAEIADEIAAEIRYRLETHGSVRG